MFVFGHLDQIIKNEKWLDEIHKLLLQNKFHSIEVNDAGLTLGLLWLWHFLPISPEISPLVPQSQLWKGEEDRRQSLDAFRVWAKAK